MLGEGDFFLPTMLLMNGAAWARLPRHPLGAVTPRDVPRGHAPAEPACKAIPGGEGVAFPCKPAIRQQHKHGEQHLWVACLWFQPAKRAHGADPDPAARSLTSEVTLGGSSLQPLRLLCSFPFSPNYLSVLGTAETWPYR